MTVPLQEYLANALRRVVPEGRGLTVVSDILSEMRAVIDLTPQSTRIEWDSHLLTATVTSTPQFSVPETVLEEITVYHHISVQRIDGPVDGGVWFVDVVYPGLASDIRVIAAAIHEARMTDLISVSPAFTVPDFDSVSRQGKPLTVFPKGVLRVQRLGDVLGTQRTRCQYVRQVFGGSASAELQNDLTGGFV